MKILVVDDAMFMRNMLTETFQSSGHVVVGHASDGIEAIEQYKHLKPDMVTMDITMPNASGLDAIKGIMEYDPSASILVCSAVGHKQNVLEAMKLGAKNFIVKPFVPEKALAAIDAIAKQKEKEKQEKSES